ncbi:MAG: carbonic anhydrase family protein [Myxococcales bacterium]|nr:carbonic anhydrase family protein [Myxococcales bacterium]
MEPARALEAHERGTYLTPEMGIGIIQSPVNIVTRDAKGATSKVVVHYGRSNERALNLGHTVEVMFDERSNWCEVDGAKYELKQFHFHTPSEHLIDGVTYPMEMHLVHAKADEPDKFMVIGILFKQGSDNPLLASFIDKIPESSGTEGVPGEIDLMNVVNSNESFYVYRGSLTTPPYSETVHWHVAQQVREPRQSRSSTSSGSKGTTRDTSKSSAAARSPAVERAFVPSRISTRGRVRGPPGPRHRVDR